MKLLRTSALAAIGLIGSGGLLWLGAQDRPTFRIKVDMVVLSFTVTDSKGHYINGLKPADFKITEDGIVQKVNTFGEGSRPPLQVLQDGTTRALSSAAENGSGTEGGA
ncbi:MAG TPA: VWA domain-containing protein, partial [Bryobacteraceae bacterium]